VNARFSVILVVAMAGLLAGLGAFRQRAQLSGLRSELAQLQSRRAAVARPISNPVAREPAPAAAPLSEADKQELMRLRGEVAGLLRRQRELASVRQENASLRGSVSPGTANAIGTKLPPGYVRRAQAKLAGTGSPEAALQSFFWSLEHRDTNQLFQVIDLDVSQQLQEQLTRDGIDKFWEEARQLPGYAVVASEPVSDSEVRLQVQLIPDTDPERIELRRDAGGWRITQFDH
jgi:hypothetical protein